MDSQIKPICFVSQCQEGKQHREGTAEVLQGRAPEGVVLWSRIKYLPHLQQWELSSPCPPRLGAAGSASPVRDEGGKRRVLGPDAPGQGRAQAVVPQRLHGHDLTDAAHLGAKEGENQCQQVHLDHCTTLRLKMHHLVRASASAHRSSAP